jgi:hypothetical protein
LLHWLCFIFDDKYLTLTIERELGPETRGRCYNRIFRRKNGVFLKNQCYDQIFALFQ